MKKNKMLIFLILFICLIFFLKYRRQYSIWDEDIKLLNGDSIKLHHKYSQRAKYGPPHFEFGGGSDKYEVWFSYKDKNYFWKCVYTPVVMQYWEGAFYIVMFDRENQWDIKLRFYKYINSLSEILPSEFPKHIAIQNRWISIVASSYRNDLPFEKYEINPENIDFRKSFTAKIWINLEKNVNLKDVETERINRDFLKEYKIKYIDPIWGNKFNEKNK